MSGKVKNWLVNSGLILAIVSGGIHIALIVILVDGFERNLEDSKLLLFSALNALFVVLISLFMRSQGIQYAKNEPTNIKLIEELRDLRAKDTKNKWILPIEFYMTFQLLKDIIVKGLGVSLTLYYSITIVIEGINDDRYILMAITSTVAALGFGMFDMVKSYEKYNDSHVKYLKNKIAKEKQKNEIHSRTEETNRSTIERIDDNTRTSENIGTIQEIA